MPQRCGELSSDDGRVVLALTPARRRLPGLQTALKLFGSLHLRLYRASNGALGRTLRGGPVLLLTTTGRMTRRARTAPLCYVEDGEGMVVVAAAAGAPKHPGWYLNLEAHPAVTVTVGSESHAMVAQTVRGFDRQQLWTRLVRQYPMLVDYQRRVRRELPVIALRPATMNVGM